MGIDTRYFGPSGWDLFHRVSFHSTNPHNLLKNMAEVLPCKFCRNSTRKYVRELPYDPRNPAKWLYEIHNKVNDKLRSQCSKDPKVVDPGPDPSFEEIQKRYKSKTLDEKVGQVFLMCVAVNTPRKLGIQKRLLKNLAEAYPLFGKFYKENPPDFSKYPEWMHKFAGVSIQEVEKYKSKCKTGKTCRKSNGGSRRLRVGIGKKTQRN